MRRCDKISADPKAHLGPFTVLDTYEDYEEPSQVARCEACGNAVTRKLRAKRKNPQPPAGSE
jgi:hypothetical protein